MPALPSFSDFGGEIPLVDPRYLPQSAAAEAWNVDLTSGPLNGARIPVLIQDLTAFGTVKRAYRLPGPNPAFDPDVWLPLPSPFSSAVRSPLANDTLHRVYWTSPGLGAFWNSYARVAAGNTGGNAPYNLGVITPDPTNLITVGAAGGASAASDFLTFGRTTNFFLGLGNSKP
jgi:hypothetical protein